MVSPIFWKDMPPSAPGNPTPVAGELVKEEEKVALVQSKQDSLHALLSL